MLEGADVASLAADDAALDVIGGNLDGGDGALCGVIGRHALDRDGENLARLAVRLGLGTRFDIANDARGLCGAILAYVLENDLACLLLGQGGDVEQTALGFLELGLELLAQAFRARLEAVELLLALVKAGAALVQGVFALLEALGTSLHVLALLADLLGLATGLLLRLLLDPECLVLGLDGRFAADVLG